MSYCLKLFKLPKIQSDLFTLFIDSYSFPLLSKFYPIPGIILIKLFRDPNFSTVEYCPFKSFKVKLPLFKLSIILDYSSGLTASFTTLNSFETSPIPSNRLIND